jgi:hypothetical protein
MRWSARPAAAVYVLESGDVDAARDEADLRTIFDGVRVVR